MSEEGLAGTGAWLGWTCLGPSPFVNPTESVSASLGANDLLPLCVRKTGPILGQQAHRFAAFHPATTLPPIVVQKLRESQGDTHCALRHCGRCGRTPGHVTHRRPRFQDVVGIAKFTNTFYTFWGLSVTMSTTARRAF